MHRVVVDKKLDIFDYVVDFAVKQHNRPEPGSRMGELPELYNIASRDYMIKFCGANGRAYRCFKEKFNYELVKNSIGATILKWQKDGDEIEMSVKLRCSSPYRHTKKRYLFVNYIVVNNEQVFKCRPCFSSNHERDSHCNWTWRYWFEY